MADTSEEVRLPPTVEETLRRISEEHMLPPPDIRARRQLSLLGEEASLEMLGRIQNLSDYIIYSAGVSCPVSSQGSGFFSGPQKSDSSVSVNQPGDVASDSLSSEELLNDINLPLSHMEELNKKMSLNSSFLEKKPSRSLISPLLLSLGELEFRKAFLILSYSGAKKLEDFITVDMVQRLKNLPMIEFELELWKVLGKKCIEEADRMKSLDWDSGKTYLYRCHVDPVGNCIFKGPYLQKQRTHLQRVLGDDNVLDVRFVKEVVNGTGVDINCNISNAAYQHILKEGIRVGLRRYRFFVFKDGGKEEKKKSPTSSPVKCYFACMESNAAIDEKKPYILFNKSIHEARCVFMHVHTVSSLAKYMARFSLILSKTLKLQVDLTSVHIESIGDKHCLDEHGRNVYSEDGKDLIHTNGTGFISEDLAVKCPRNIFKGNYSTRGEFERILDRIELDEKSSQLTESTSHIREPPLLIQFRLFNDGCAVKGTLLVNKKLPPKTIQIRPSMIKVETDRELFNTESANSLEIVSTSNQPRRTSYLSRYLIAHLNYGGVPREYFMELLKNALEDAQSVHYNKRAALTVGLNHGEMDDFLLPRMILCGIPLDEPYLQHRLSVLLREERKGLKEGKLPAKDCYYLMGTADPTGMLNTDEVCIILGDGQISGKVLVYRHPGLHFGDIHVLTATYVKDLELIVGNAKYAIFFPTKGPRSLADEMANGDFDGDMYWVSRNPQLLEHFKQNEPWKQPHSTNGACHRKPTDFSSDELENNLFRQFLTTRFCPSYTTGEAADNWLAFMDRVLTLGDECADEINCVKEKMLRLTNIYYDSVDAPKTGKKVEVPNELKADKFPHFMGRLKSYISKSILGLIYDEVDSFQPLEPSKEVWKLPCFSGEVPKSSVMLWKDHYDRYRKEMRDAMGLDSESKDEATSQIIQKYKQILYGAGEFEESTRKREEIFNEAHAIYQITYDYAKSNGVARCCFAWNVAGRALCTLHAIKQDKDIIVCLKSVLREILN